jgi:hypothetical protein
MIWSCERREAMTWRDKNDKLDVSGELYDLNCKLGTLATLLVQDPTEIGLYEHDVEGLGLIIRDLQKQADKAMDMANELERRVKQVAHPVEMEDQEGSPEFETDKDLTVHFNHVETVNINPHKEP